MTINIEKMRTEISAQCEKIFKYQEMGNTKKGVYAPEFQKMLYFSDSQKKEFREFLRNINAGEG
jgi:hypothetical protein